MATAYRRWIEIRDKLHALVPDAYHDFSTCALYSDRDPKLSLSHARRALEALVAALTEMNNISVTGDKLANHIAQLESNGVIPSRIKYRMDTIRNFGNLASHYGSNCDEFDSDRAFSDLVFVFEWMINLNCLSQEQEGNWNPELSAGLALLKRHIDSATEDQKVVLDSLKKYRRVSISGTAGSGKTILAMEKASQLDKAGLDVLFLCHNPHLATVIADALIFTSVEVCTFSQFISDRLGNGNQTEWSHYTDINDNDINTFLNHVNFINKFDAIIVDEAQDFKDIWWDVLERMIKSDKGFLYIFFDNDQSLLPFRSNYPDTDFTYHLTSNVRNANEIAEAVCKLNRTPPSPHPYLTGGTLRVTRYERGQENLAQTAALSNIRREGLLKNSALVVTDVVDPSTSALAGSQFTLLADWSWQNALEKAIPGSAGLIGRTRAPSRPQQNSAFPDISAEQYPTQQDIDAIAIWARAILSQFARSRKVSDLKGLVQLRSYGDRVEFSGFQSLPGLAYYLAEEPWFEQLPKAMTVRLVPPGQMQEGCCIPLHSAASVKGLEFDGVVTCIPQISSDLKSNAYVAFSRARLHQEVVVLQEAAHRLPSI